MRVCRKCERSLSAADLFCAGCGKEVSPDPDRTVDLPGQSLPGQSLPGQSPQGQSLPEAASSGTDETMAAPPPSPSPAGTPPRRTAPSRSRTPISGSAPTPPPSSQLSRFASGELIGDRYRIVSLLGRGGMGEVYRADDLRLGESVALKFLPPEWASDGAARQRLLDEVRVTRQVSHANVCRVHDLVEVEGEACISMEYIDGEDLASLLRRIGRLPEDKGIEIARQLCAGLAAAHARGVLHRDLKPANVMIDGRGGVKINDFGIAALVESGGSDDGFAGTPLYMAPEVIEGAPASVASDIYSLGLVLHELFTGRRAVEGTTFSEIRGWHRRHGSVALSQTASLDPVIANAIERTLDADPALRPADAHGVAALLPGGDPLLAALAAGETPSPELVAAAGGTGCVSHRAGMALFGLVIVALAFLIFFEGRVRITGIAPLDVKPDVLEDVSGRVLREFGYEEEWADSARGFVPRDALTRHIESTDAAPDRWELISEPDAALLQFWFRVSPEGLVTQIRADGRVTLSDPPPDRPGMASVLLSASSRRLLQFTAIPVGRRSPKDTVVDPVPEPPWEAVIAACGFEPGELAATDPSRLPATRFDERRAWRGAHPRLPGVTTTVEAAAWQGRIVSVQVDENWTPRTPRGDIPLPGSWRGENPEVLTIALFFFTLLVGGWFGFSNLRAGRGDRAGAFRLALFLLSMNMIVWLLRSHHTFQIAAEQALFIRALSNALFTACFAWALYLAIEPTIRRSRPQMLVSWTRLLRGRGRGDPIVARDILVGILCGVTMGLLVRAHWVVAARFTGVPPAPIGVEESILGSARQAFGQLFWIFTDATFITLIASFLLSIALMLTGRRWVGYSVLFLLGILQMSFATQSESVTLDLAMRALAMATFLVALDRSFLSLLATLVVYSLLETMVVTLDPDTWILPQGLMAVGLIAGGAFACALRACRRVGELPGPERAARVDPISGARG